jgi:hypothetical protein
MFRCLYFSMVFFGSQLSTDLPNRHHCHFLHPAGMNDYLIHFGCFICWIPVTLQPDLSYFERLPLNLAALLIEAHVIDGLHYGRLPVSILCSSIRRRLQPVEISTGPRSPRSRRPYKILFNYLLSQLTPYTDEITGDHQCGFGCNM